MEFKTYPEGSSDDQWGKLWTEDDLLPAKAFGVKLDDIPTESEPTKNEIKGDEYGLHLCFIREAFIPADKPISLSIRQ